MHIQMMMVAIGVQVAVARFDAGAATRNHRREDPVRDRRDERLAVDRPKVLINACMEFKNFRF